MKAHGFILMRNPFRFALPVLTALALLENTSTLYAQRESGEWIFVSSPITSETVARAKNQTERALKQRQARKIVYHFQGGEPSLYGECANLADFILETTKGQASTHAFIDRPLKGFAVLPALACRFVYVGPEGGMGFDEEALRRAGSIDASKVNKFLDVVERRGRPAALVLKMLDPGLAVYLVESPMQGKQYKLDINQAARYPVDQKTFLTAEDRNAQPRDVYKAGAPGYFGADELVLAGLAGRKYSGPQQLAEALGLPGSVVAGNPLLALDHPPITRVIEIRGEIDRGVRDTLDRQISRAIERDHANCIIFAFQEVTGGPGSVKQAIDIARQIRELNDRVLTVAYIANRASGGATYVALGCSQIVMAPRAVLGDCEQLVYREKGRPFADADVQPYRDNLMRLGEEQGYSPVLLRGLMDLPLEIVQVRAKPDANRVEDVNQVVTFLPRGEAEAAKDQWIILEGPPVKKAGALLKLDTDSALNWGIARHRVENDDYKSVAALYGIDPEQVREIKTDWLDALVNVITHPVATVFLVIIGFTCLILEFKAPGLGLPAVISAVCFLLVFWAHSWLAREVNSLAILLFMLGIILILVEIFLFPGLAITIISGIVLILLSLALLMVRHWPESHAEYMELGKNFGMFGAGLLASFFAAYSVARFLPYIPYANRMILAAPDEETSDAAGTLPLAESATLLGAIGIALTELRPAGKARFGERFVDVTAEGSFVEAGRRVQVIEIDGMRVMVKAV
jgi:membrane-bound ClpP family serine protease